MSPEGLQESHPEDSLTEPLKAQPREAGGEDRGLQSSRYQHGLVTGEKAGLRIYNKHQCGSPADWRQDGGVDDDAAVGF